MHTPNSHVTLREGSRALKYLSGNATEVPHSSIGDIPNDSRSARRLGPAPDASKSGFAREWNSRREFVVVNRTTRHNKSVFRLFATFRTFRFETEMKPDSWR